MNLISMRNYFRWSTSQQRSNVQNVEEQNLTHEVSRQEPSQATWKQIAQKVTYKLLYSSMVGGLSVTNTALTLINCDLALSNKSFYQINFSSYIPSWTSAAIFTTNAANAIMTDSCFSDRPLAERAFKSTALITVPFWLIQSLLNTASFKDKFIEGYVDNQIVALFIAQSMTSACVIGVFIFKSSIFQNFIALYRR